MAPPASPVPAPRGMTDEPGAGRRAHQADAWRVCGKATASGSIW